MEYSVHVMTPAGEHHLKAEGGTLYACLSAGGILLDSPCGGHCFCGKCKVRVSPVLPPLPGEKELLTETELASGIRLACAVRVDRDLEVTVTGDQGEASILTEGAVRELRVANGLRRTVLDLPAGSLSDQSADADRLLKALPAKKMTLSALRALPSACRKEHGRITCVLNGDTVLRVTAGESAERIVGMAADIGTTTVVVYLMDMETGEMLGAESAMNPQKLHGDDVITRIEYARTEGGLETLRDAVIGCLNALTGKLCGRLGIPADTIVRTVLVGNTTMVHLLMGVSPDAIAAAPFLPAFRERICARASETGLTVLPEADVWILPSVSGYVGADITAGILASGMDRSDELTLLVDIGTNGEMVLGNKDRLLACSTAAGPALEGAHISSGMSALTGAVTQTLLKDGKLEYKVMGGGEPRGICGSGLVDLVAALLQSGALDPYGRLDPDEAPDSWEDRFTKEGRGYTFELTPEVRFTQKDVREVQLAKGAVAAGIRVLADRFGVKIGEISRVCLAGGFGNYIDVGHACDIGLLPSELRDRIRGIGNSAGDGAKLVLLEESQMTRADNAARRTEYIELSAITSFTDLFAEEMLFPED